MLRLSLGSKLLIAFLVVLLPMLALIIYDYETGYQRLSDEILDDQMRTSQAIAALADATIDDALSIAWAFSKDPVVWTMDTRQIDPHLASLKPSLPQFDDVAVIDLEGNGVGIMALSLPPDAPRPSAVDRAYFQAVKSTGQPAVSNVLISRVTGNPIVVVAVPLADSSPTLRGVIIAALDLDYLAQRVATVGLDKSQAIFMTDTEGTVAFHTLLPREEWGHRNLSDYAPVRSALSGVPAREKAITSPMGDVRIVVAARTLKHGWVVGVSVSRDVAVSPLQAELLRRLVTFLGVMAFASLVALLLSRRMILRPLEVLRGHLAAFGSGQFGRRVDLRTGDEMELMAHTFNRMASQLQQWSQEREVLLQEAVRARGELEEARRRREEFILMVAHELRNPLAVIVGYGQIAAKAVREGKETDPRAIADTILDQATRLRRLVEDLADVSLIEAERFQVVRTSCDLRRTAQDVAHQQQMTTTKHRIVVDAPQEPVVGNWDCERLAQALGNLVNNAIKYSPYGGEVVIRLATADHEVTVSVSDQGIGIPPEDIPHLFQPFSKLYREQPARGTGLGLYIAKAIVEAHGGRIWVQSEKDAGSTFSFAISRSADSNAPLEPGKTKARR